jgi:hypothetical protein
VTTLKGSEYWCTTPADRINAMRHVLGKFDYDNKDREVVAEADPLIVGRALVD